MTALKGKVAVITGASSGIGSTIASHLAQEGASVVLSARREDRLKQLERNIQAEGGEALVVPTDITVKSDVEHLIQKAKDTYGSIDILINNAGVMLLSFLKNDQVEQWEQMVDVNVKGVLYGIHAALPTMLEQNRGHIVNVSSVAGHEVFPSSSVYSATKFAVRALSMGMEKELAKTGIRVTNISPGAVQTELTEHITDKEVLDLFGQKEMATLQADDIARSVLYAVSQPAGVNVNEVTVRPQ